MTVISLLLLSTGPLVAAPEGVLLDFTARWCRPCQQMSPIVERLKRQGYPIRKVDVDREPELAKKFRITSMPTFVLVVGGREVRRTVGLSTESELKRLLAQIPRHDPPKKPPHSTFPKANVPIIAVADRSKRTRLKGISIPFFGGKERKKAAASVGPQVPPIIRAKFDRRAEPAAHFEIHNPLATSTRIRVKDNEGFNFGSATMIDSRPGRTILLTCGHLFRGLNNNSTIEVDVFHGQQVETYVGRVIRYDLKADVGLVSIATEVVLPASTVARSATRVRRGEHVFSIGCSAGEPPTKLQMRVTALNRYLGPDNIECSQVPVQGRSGGGLFNTAGQVIGVCVAADPKDKRGLYAGLKAIQQQLDAAGLARLYRTAKQSPAADRPQIGLAAVDPSPSRQPTTTGRAEVSTRSSELTGDSSRGNSGQSDSETVGPTSRQRASIRAALEQTGEAEVICIVRPLGDPQAASRVVIINRASPKFISYLTSELKQQPQTTMQSFKLADDVTFAGHPPRLQPSWWTQPAELNDSVPVLSVSDKSASHEPRRYRRSAASR